MSQFDKKTIDFEPGYGGAVELCLIRMMIGRVKGGIGVPWFEITDIHHVNCTFHRKHWPTIYGLTEYYVSGEF
jgi:hypothetical protein